MGGYNLRSVDINESYIPKGKSTFKYLSKLLQSTVSITFSLNYCSLTSND